MEKNTPLSRISIEPRSVLVVLGIVAVVYGLWYVRGTLLVVLASVVIATFVYGGVNMLARLKIPRPVAVVLIYVLGAGLVIGGLYLFVPIFLDELISLVGLLPADSGFATLFGSFGDGQVKDLLGQFNGSDPLEAVNHIREQFATTGLWQTVGVFFGGLLNFLLVIIISFYLAIQDRGVEQFLRIVTPITHEAYVLDVWQRSRIKIASWFRGQLLSACIQASLTYVGLLIIGVPYAFMLSLVTLVLSLIPFGIILATVPAGIFAFLAGGMPMLLLVMALYFVLEQFESYVLQPIIIKRVTGVPSVIVLIALVVGAQLAGILGILLSVPVAVLLLELINDAEKRRIDALSD
jgi:predicted PurR-regulated permease PerM